jgi:hypothetical protein
LQLFHGLSGTYTELIRCHFPQVPSEGSDNLGTFTRAFDYEEMHEVSSTPTSWIPHLQVSKGSDDDRLAAIETNKNGLPVMLSDLRLYQAMFDGQRTIFNRKLSP